MESGEKRLRWLLVGVIVLCLGGALAVVLRRRDVGDRLPPKPTAISPPIEPSDPAKPTRTSRTDRQGIEQVWVPDGFFRRGSDPDKNWWSARTEETPQHDVRLTRGFWIDKLEVTNAAFNEFVTAGGYRRDEFWSEAGRAWRGDRAGPDAPPRPGFLGMRQPRVWITWHEADAYARWRGGRLPTEAEWEYAARGPAGTIYPWGDAWNRARAITSEGGVDRTADVGTRIAGKSWCGALDMSGNAWEWVADWFDAAVYGLAEGEDPRGPDSGVERGTRGGSFADDRANARAAQRGHRVPAQPSLSIGFRIVSEED